MRMGRAHTLLLSRGEQYELAIINHRCTPRVLFDDSNRLIVGVGRVRAARIIVREGKNGLLDDRTRSVGGGTFRQRNSNRQTRRVHMSPFFEACPKCYRMGRCNLDPGLKAPWIQ